MAAALPAGLHAYRRTPIFDQDSIPAGLRRNHRTRPGVWALITILEGSLRLRTFDPPNDTLLLPASSAAVAPQEPHEVEPDGPVRFFLEFYCATAAADDPAVPSN